MYLVQIFDGPTDTSGITIHSPYVGGAKLLSPQVTLKLTGIDEFTFQLAPNNPGYRRIKQMTTLVRVTNTKTGKRIFDGRILQAGYRMDENGKFVDEYTCESKLAYLQDSLQRFDEIHNTSVRDFFALLINRHNQMVEPHKRFKVGDVTVTNTTDNVYRYIDYEKTYPTIKDKLLDRLGGFLVMREESDGTYLDYLAKVGSVSDTTISIRRNLKSISRGIDPTDVVTRLIPLGARLESDKQSSASTARVDIKSVNGGVDYLDDISLQAEFGIVHKEVVWDDVTQPQNLLAKGREFLSNQKAAIETFDISAIDLSLLGLDVAEFSVGNWYYIDNPYIVAKESLQIIEKVIDLANSQQSRLTFGEKARTLTQYLQGVTKLTSRFENVRSQVESQTIKIGTISAELAEAKAELEATQQSLAQFEGGTTEGMAQINAAIGNINASITDLQTIIDEIESVVSAEEIAQMKSDIEANTNGLTAADAQIEDLVARVTALENAAQNNEGGTVE
ncbi:phage tail protein [Bacillus sp. PK3-056]|uniref:phage tail spike protein n=1 Tax=Niallia circulans TaxID=1397 RepID=UPI000F447FE3|nr:phage tail spike protein [Niallia circulans]AYV74331.1 lysin [Niallia circulans]